MTYQSSNSIKPYVPAEHRTVSPKKTPRTQYRPLKDFELKCSDNDYHDLEKRQRRMNRPHKEFIATQEAYQRKRDENLRKKQEQRDARIMAMNTNIPKINEHSRRLIQTKGRYGSAEGKSQSAHNKWDKTLYHDQ